MQRTLTEITRKLDTDKKESPGYLHNYERHLGRLRSLPVRLLELGVFPGGSLLMWQEYFSNGLAVGLDIKPNPFTAMPERVRFYQGAQDDEILLDAIARECAPDGFDIIIDDASHVGTLSRRSFRFLFEKHLKPGGIYVIEDWGTGYWDSWRDGMAYRMARENEADGSQELSLLERLARRLRLAKPSSVTHRATDPEFAAHNFGMVGFVKELVDEVAWPDITSPERGNSGLLRRQSMISEMTVYHGQVFLRKSLG